MQHLLFFIANIFLFIAFESSITISLTIINKCVLVNDTHLTIKINTISHFLNNNVKLK